MAKQKKQDRNRQQKERSPERKQEQDGQKEATSARERMGSPADVARKGKKPSFGHN